MNSFILVLLGVAAGALAQIMLKQSSSYSFLKEYYFFIYFILAALFYLISFVIYAYILKTFNLSKISPVMTVGTMLSVVLAGVLIFKESVTMTQIFGILIGFISIILVIK